MKRTIKSEFAAGKKSSLLTGTGGLLAQENLQKAEIGIKSSVELIRAYWLGYLAGINENKN